MRRLLASGAAAFRAVLRPGFARQAGGLAFFNVLAEGAGVAALLVLDRFYSQADIGALAVFLTYALLLAAFSLLSYPQVLPNLSAAALKSLTLSLLGLAALSAGAAFLGAALLDYPHAIALGLSTLFSALIQLSDHVNLQAQRVRRVAWARASTRLLFLAGLAGLALNGAPAPTLVWAHAASVALVAAAYVVPSLRDVLGTGRRPAFAEALRGLLEHRRFPLLVAPSQVFNLLAYQLPVLLIDGHFGAAAAAQYTVTLRVCASPLGVVANAVAQAYHARLAHALRTGQDFYPRFRRLSAWLMVAGAAAGAAVFFLFPPALLAVLGPEWALAADLLRLMAPLYAVMLVVSSLGQTFVVLGDELFLFVNQFVYALISLACFAVGIRLDSLRTGVVLFTALSVLRYAAIFARIRFLTRRRFQETSA